MDLLYFTDGTADKFVFYASPALRNFGTVTNRTVTPGTILWIDDLQVSNYAKIEEENPSALSIYPNPVTSVFTVTAAEKIEVIRIFSVDGKLLTELIPNAISTEVIMEEFHSGTYFVSATIGGITTTNEVIKE